MRDHDNRSAVAGLSEKTGLYDLCVLLVYVARWLIGQDDGRLPDQSASDGCPLLLADTKLSRLVVQPVFDTKTLGQLADGGLYVPAPPLQNESQSNIIENCQVGHEEEPLEHEAHALLAIAVPAAGAPAVDIVTVEEHTAFVRW